MREKKSNSGRSRLKCDLVGAKCLLTFWPLLFCVLSMAVTAHLAFAAEATKAKTVLILYSFSDREAQGDLGILKATTRTFTKTPVDFHVEYLDSSLFDTPGYEKAVSQTLNTVYAGKKIDLVITAFYPALRFAVNHRQELFPDTPIVFSSLPADRLQGQQISTGMTGITIDIDLRGTIDLALRLQPGAKNVAVVVGNSEPDRYWLVKIKQELQLHQPGLNVIYLAGLSSDQLLTSVAALPAHTLIFFQVISQDAAQPVVGTFDLLRTIAKQFQTYCFVERCMGLGAVGGSYPDSFQQDKKTGELAARVLSGARAENIPVMIGPPALAHVDWRQLRRWNIPESALPSGTVILYRQPNAWVRYRNYIAVGMTLILLQAMLIIGLLLQRTTRRKIDLRLRESEKRFRLMADTTPALIWMCDKDGHVTYLNNRLNDFTGRDRSARLEDLWSAFVHPDDIVNARRINMKALEQKTGFSREYRLRRHDGVYRWVLDVVSPRLNGKGLFAGFIGSAVDITDQKLAREALENIGGRLIEAQEEERSRIARELHDDICQRLALLAMELEQANQGANYTTGNANPKIEVIRQHCAEIAVDVQALSYRLHSSKLEYLGVVAAIKSFCREFAQQNEVQVDFSELGVSAFLPQDISLSLFRITQEALQNALKHSGVRNFTVSLSGSIDGIQLVVVDKGRGFDVEQAKRERGLGLISMQERVHLIHGIFNMESTPNGGTTVLVRVPLQAETKAVVNSVERI